MEVGDVVGELIGLEVVGIAVVGVAAGMAMTLDARSKMASALSVNFLLEVCVEFWGNAWMG